jgi:uncharacterized damage-inducible protein DinB
MLPEPWLRGPVAGVPVLVAPILYTFAQAREDLAKHTEGLTAEQIWASPHGFGSVGFHMRHIAGSTERLMTYLVGRQLTEDQMRAIAEESKPLAIGRDELLALLDRSLAAAEGIVRGIDPATLEQPRAVGRKKLPTTVIGLLTHIAEHMQRHVGQAISAAKWARVTP